MVLKNIHRPIIVIGGVVLDITATATSNSFQKLLRTSTPGTVSQTLGGVGRNVCEAAMRTGAPSVLLSVVGKDTAGDTIKQQMTSLGMDTSLIKTSPSHSTAVYNAFHSKDGQLISAIADMDIFDYLDLSNINDIFKKYNPSLICFDGNVSAQSMQTISVICKSFGIPAFFEPTSIPKSLRIFESKDTILSGSIKYTSPNQYELEAMVDTLQQQKFNTLPFNATLSTPSLSIQKKIPSIVNKVFPEAIYLSNYIPHIITKLGEDGCLYVGTCSKNDNKKIAHYFPPEIINPDTIKSVTGAGDSFVGTLLANLQKDPFVERLDLWKSIIENGQKSAVRTLQSKLAVSDLIDNDLLVR
ncbi:Ribokinase-like protein [Cunninghamella echinulata]|nr:Ribokinase-like protein [Cunninghamella echinulata]